MEVAKLLTRKVPFGISLTVVATLGIYETHASEAWIVRLREEKADSAQVGKIASRERTRERLAKFRQDRLSRKKGLVLPRMGFLLTENLSESDIAELRNNPEVAYVERDVSWRTQDAGAPSSQPSSFEQAPWLRDVMGFSVNSPSADIAPNLNQDRVVVAVVDTGSRSEHPFLQAALEPNAREIGGLSGVDDDNNGFVDDYYGANAITRNGSGTEHSSSHGTHVAGIVKTIRDHAIREFPEAAQVSILPIRFIGDDGSGSTASAIVALEYALARGAKVVNASWGAKGNGAYSQALFDSFARLYASDVFFSVAAGNADGMGPNNNDITPYFPANYNIPSLVSVASVTPTYSGIQNRLTSLALSSFSNYGSASVQIAAPGDYSEAYGTSSGILSAYSGFSNWGSLYIKKQGTSMAAPVIAGIAAVIRAVNPALTAYETKEVILQSAMRQESLSRVQSSAVAHARNAIILAEQSTSRGLQPALPSQPVRQNGAGSLPERGGGCASVAPVSSSSGGGPFGGNSLGLLSAIYALSLLLRSRPKKQRD